MESIKWQMNRYKNVEQPLSSIATIEEIKKVLQFHQTLPGYAPTPLFQLPALAHYLGVGQIIGKDESYRFGLNSFKALGSSYAVASYLRKHEAKTFATA